MEKLDFLLHGTKLYRQLNRSIIENLEEKAWHMIFHGLSWMATLLSEIPLSWPSTTAIQPERTCLFGCWQYCKAGNGHFYLTVKKYESDRMNSSFCPRILFRNHVKPIAIQHVSFIFGWVFFSFVLIFITLLFYSEHISFKKQQSYINPHFIIYYYYLLSTLGLLHCRMILYHLSHQGSPIGKPYKACIVCSQKLFL